MNVTKRLLVLLVICIVATQTVFSITFKIGSPAPVGTPWDNVLNALAAEWREISDGRVNLKIYAGSIAGSEEDMLRKVRIGQLQGCVLTGVGLNAISQDVLILSMPLLISTYDEYRYVMEKMRPDFDERFEESGFTSVAWAMGGWIHFFAKQPVITPDDLKHQKLSVSPSEENMQQAFKELGFHVVPLHMNEIMTALQTGMVEAYYAPPLLSAAYQWFALTNHMCDMRVSPLVGSLVFGKRFWDRVPDDLEEELIATANRLMEPLYDEIMELDSKAMKVMREHGLVTHQVDDAARKEWRSMFEQGYRGLMGKSFSKEIYEQLQGHLNDYRESHGN